MFSQARECCEIKSALGEINPEKRKQHPHAAEECVEEKLCRGAIAIFAAPDFDQQKRRDQTHFIEQKPEDKILCRERPAEGGLHYWHVRIEPATAWQRTRKTSERDDQRRQQNEQDAQLSY